MPTWRFIESPPSDIASEMEFDRALFEEALNDLCALPVLRIYRVSKPGVTVGRSYSRSLRGAAGGGGLAMTSVCVRPTGGGRVNHGDDLIYSVVARPDTFPTFRQVRTSYLSFHEAVQEAFRNLGIETQLLRCDQPELKKNSGGLIGDCFKEPVPTDLALGGQKIAGGAQRRRANAFLHQGSVKLPPGIFFEALKEALTSVFETKFEAEWVSGRRIEQTAETHGRN